MINQVHSLLKLDTISFTSKYFIVIPYTTFTNGEKSLIRSSERELLE